MPIDNYGVWKARPVDYAIKARPTDGPKMPQFTLYFQDENFRESQSPTATQKDKSKSENGRGSGWNRTGSKDRPGGYRASVDITSGDLHDSRLVYWVNHHIDENPIIDELRVLESGFHKLSTQNDRRKLGLDYIRSNLSNTTNGRTLPHDVPGQFNDIVDIIAPSLDEAIEHDASIYIFGSRTPNMSKAHIHDIHMNQGNGRKFCGEDGVYQDGGLIFQFQKPEEWLGIFLAFSSQAVHTDPRSGHAISGVDWRDLLRPDIIEDGVLILEAFVHPIGGEGGMNLDHQPESGPLVGRMSITLANRTNRPVSLKRWSLRNGAGEVQTFRGDASLRPRIAQRFDLTSFVLSDHGDTIFLLNEDGMKVDGVSYNWQQGVKGGPIVFSH